MTRKKNSMFDNEITWIQQQQRNKNELITKHQQQSQERQRDKKSYTWYMCFQLCKMALQKYETREFEVRGRGEWQGGYSNNNNSWWAYITRRSDCCESVSVSACAIKFVNKVSVVVMDTNGFGGPIWREIENEKNIANAMLDGAYWCPCHMPYASQS